MGSQLPLHELARDIKAIHSSDPSKAETLIEGYLEERLKGLSPDERLSIIEGLSMEFKGKDVLISSSPLFNPEMISRLYSLLLGEGIPDGDLTSGEALEKLTRSLNTIFDKLNELVKVINVTLLGKAPELETIRHVIGSELKEETQSRSLEEYLDRIKKAFLSAHEVFKKAACIKVQEILSELDPNIISSAVEKGLKFGPLRKAECFKIYQERFEKCKKWLESGRFMEDLLREFEKNVKIHFLEKGGEI